MNKFLGGLVALLMLLGAGFYLIVELAHSKTVSELIVGIVLTVLLLGPAIVGLVWASAHAIYVCWFTRDDLPGGGGSDWGDI